MPTNEPTATPFVAGFLLPSMRAKPRDAAIIDMHLSGDDHAMTWGIDATVDVDFDREQIIKVLAVDNVVFRSKTYGKDGLSDIRHSMGPDAKEFWLHVARIYADNLGSWELDWVRDKVRGVVALVGNQ